MGPNTQYTKRSDESSAPPRSGDIYPGMCAKRSSVAPGLCVTHALTLPSVRVLIYATMFCLVSLALTLTAVDRTYLVS